MNSKTKKNCKGWRRYINGIAAAEVSATTRFCDACVQVEPLPHDTGDLLEQIVCPLKLLGTTLDTLGTMSQDHNARVCVLLNGNFNYCLDIQDMLGQIWKQSTRHTRLFVIVYNPFMSIVYNLASRLGVRKAPVPNVFITEQSLRNLAVLSGYEVVRIRPCLFIPFPIPLLSNWVNRFLAAIPFVRRLALLWVVVLRPLIPQTRLPSLSIIVPTRNEAGNIPHVVKRLPPFGSAAIELIFVEGHSTDETWMRIQEQVNAEYKDITIRSLKQSGFGKNNAVQEGLAQATGELAAILDADMTMPPEKLGVFYETYRKGHGDFINGSRLIYPMESGAMRPMNRIGNILFAKLLARTLDLRITDSLCGTKLLAVRDYERVMAWRERFGNFDPFGDFDLLFAASELALGVMEVPVRYRVRSYGTTNIQRFRDGLRLAKMLAVGFLRIKLGKMP